MPYARSEAHLNELVDTICKQFEDYAQAKTKTTGEPTIIRIVTRNGGMNPKFGEVDIVPDEDLNTRLKFYVSGPLFDLQIYCLPLENAYYLNHTMQDGNCNLLLPV